MQVVKNSFKLFVIPLIIFCIISLIYTTILYFDIFVVSEVLDKIILLLIGITYFFIQGYFVGKLTKQKGMLYGFITSLVMIFLIGLVFNIFKDLVFFKILKYIIFILSSVTGSIISVNKFSRHGDM